MIMRAITDRVSWLGAADWNRRLFDALIPLPEGTSSNAYLVRGSEKTALVLVGPHPAAVYAAYLANAIRPKVKFATVIGSYGWGTKAVETIAGMIPNLKVEILPPVYCKGHPREQDFEALRALADTIVAKHRDLSMELPE